MCSKCKNNVKHIYSMRKISIALKRETFYPKKEEISRENVNFMKFCKQY